MPKPHLTFVLRSEFAKLKAQSLSICVIAKMLEVHFSCLYRELKRCGSPEHYCPLLAQREADAFKAASRKKSKDTPENRAFIERNLLEHWTPDTISGRQKLALKEFCEVTPVPIREDTASTDSTPPPAAPKPPVQLGRTLIYEIIARDRREGGELYLLLPRQGRRYRRKRTTVGRNGAGRLPVKPEQELTVRFVSILDRLEPGHWEIDLMFAGETILLTAIDRATRLVDVQVLDSKDAAKVAEEVLAMCLRLRVRTLTTDRGLEWAGLDAMTAKLALSGIKVNLYFCAPYHSWEKGGIENFNRLLRRYYPKGVNFPWTPESQAKAQEAVLILNSKPRKVLGYRTPLEADAAWDQRTLEATWKMRLTASPQVA